MLRPALITTLLIAIISIGARAQTPRRDSITNIAKQDAALFWLDKRDLKTFRKDRHNYTSDFFKPAKTVVSDTALLKDSVYVKTYRRIAYKKTRRRRTAGHYFLTAYAVLGVLLTIAYTTTPGKH